MVELALNTICQKENRTGEEQGMQPIPRLAAVDFTLLQKIPH
jgi:hypothetical protein